MKAPAKTAISLGLILIATWIATPYLGPAKLKAQFATEEKANALLMEQMKIDPRPPPQESSLLRVQFLHTAAPLYFEAQTSVRGSTKYWGDLDREKDIVKDDWGRDDTATYLYTPWRVYQLKISKHAEFYTRGVSLRERMQHEKELAAKAQEREALAREAAQKKP